MKNWLNEFNCGRRSLKDEVRENSTKTDVVSDNFVAVREQIMQDRHVTYSEIGACFGISSTSIPGRKKICFRWIPHNLTHA